MPRIADQIVDCSIYLYETEQDAREGSKAGGSGFLVHVLSEPTIAYPYAVSNKHVIQGDCVVVRLSRKAGGFDTLVTKQADWFFHPDGDDIAVLPLDFTDETVAQLKWWSVETGLFINKEIIEAYRVGLGDEAFMVGRLLSHDGHQKNTPIVRFGNLSLMADPAEPIRREGGDREGFLVECRSLSGFSGSPVFIQTEQHYHDEGAQRVVDHRKQVLFKTETNDPPGRVDHMVGGADQMNPQFRAVSISGRFGPWLLGIDWGHMPLYKSVERNGIEDVSLRVELNTGIACVAPAWKILDVLNLEELVKERKKEDRRIKTQREREGVSVNDMATKGTFSKNDFESALKKVSSKLSDKK